MNRTKAASVRWLRLLFSIGIVALLVVVAGPEQIVDSLRGTKPIFLFLSFAAVAIEGSLRALNWSALLRSTLQQKSIPVGQLTLSYFAAAFLGSFVPSSAGTDLLRAAASHRLIGGRVSFHAAAVVMLNAVSWVVGCGLGLIAAATLVLSADMPVMLQPIVAILAAILIGGPMLYALLGVRRDIAILALRQLRPRWYRLRHSLRHFLDSVLVYTRSQAGLGVVILAATSALLMQSAGFMLAGLALDLNVPLPAWVLLVPVAAIARLLPLSISGFGASQAANAVVLQAFGLSLAEAMAVSTLIPAIGTVNRLVVGGIALFAAQDQMLLSTKGRRAS